MANAAAGELREIGSMTGRLGKLLRRLQRFSFPLVAAPLAGLLTRPENHTATARIEALIHLAALGCRGNEEPRLRHLREWLNTTVLKDPIGQLEIPVEDVFVSNVGTWLSARDVGSRDGLRIAPSSATQLRPFRGLYPLTSRISLIFPKWNARERSSLRFPDTAPAFHS